MRANFILPGQGKKISGLPRTPKINIKRYSLSPTIDINKEDLLDQIGVELKHNLSIYYYGESMRDTIKKCNQQYNDKNIIKFSPLIIMIISVILDSIVDNFFSQYKTFFYIIVVLLCILWFIFQFWPKPESKTIIPKEEEAYLSYELDILWQFLLKMKKWYLDLSSAVLSDRKMLEIQIEFRIEKTNSNNRNIQLSKIYSSIDSNRENKAIEKANEFILELNNEIQNKNK